MSDYSPLEEYIALLVYLDAREDYDSVETETWLDRHIPKGIDENLKLELIWGIQAHVHGFYKFARHAAVKAGVIPEQPQFDVEDERTRKREALRKLTELTEEYGGYEELNGANGEVPQ